MKALIGEALDIYAAFYFFLRFLISAEAVVVAALSALSVLLFSSRLPQAHVTSNLNLTFLVRRLLFF